MGYDYWCMLSDIYNMLHDDDKGKVSDVSRRNYYPIHPDDEESEVETELGETEDEAKLCAMISQG